MWLMFQPKPYDQSKHVPMFRADWGWFGSATNCPTWGWKSGHENPWQPVKTPTEDYPSYLFTLPKDALSTLPQYMQETDCFNED